jgi:hypothetical protein
MTSPLLTRAEAAAFCRVSLVAFEAHVRSALSPVKIGRRVLFRKEELERWLVTPEVGRSAAVLPVASTTSVSATVVDLSSDPRALEIASRLKRRRLESTQRQSKQLRSGAQRAVPAGPSRS